MIICTNQEHFEYLLKYASDGFNFLQLYVWILDAYVSDFFFHNYWNRLPVAWRNAFKNMPTSDMAFFLKEKPESTRDVLPLSLLSFKACVQKYSARRQQTNNIEALYNQVQTVKPLHCDVYRNLSSDTHKNISDDLGVTDSQHLECGEHTCATGQNLGSLPPIGADGKLHAFYKKHVKPKKQHEIVHLSQAIKLLSDLIACDHVVDVGSGLGHLARLLSFGHGLTVTSIEAADTHAPKANKYDREIEREIKKKKKKAMVAKETDDTTTNQRPVHVTSMIHANTSMDTFLATIKQSVAMATTDSNHAYTYEGQQIVVPKQTKGNLSSFSPESVASCEDACNVAACATTPMEIGATSHIDPMTTNSTCQQSTQCQQIPVHENQKMVKHEHLHSISCQIPEKLAKLKHNSKNQLMHIHVCDGNDSEYQSSRSFCKGDKYQTSQTVSTEAHSENNILTVEEGTSRNTEPLPTDACTAEVRNDGGKHSTESMGDSPSFILTGLHACGDLTSTFLRFFVNCPLARGLMSVGCCYMKLTDEGACPDNGSLSYPMSEGVLSLPSHRLSYQARELACHFADTYSQRLQGESPHLRIHGYRATLEWIANQLEPQFKRSSIQIPSKKTNKMDFECYARKGLEKFGIAAHRLTPDLLTPALIMVTRWRDVVAFYTLRLALGPVVETLILIDRMLYLYEHGISSILVPVFDPKISPRNFALIAWKT